METIACIGVGLVGCSWAVVFARAGHAVRLWDQDAHALGTARQRIAAILTELSDGGAIEAPEAVALRITAAESLEAALRGATYVQESVSERLEIKRAVFRTLDALADDDAILASSTSAIPGSHFMAGLPGAGRCLVAHPVNPPHLIPLVELCPTPETDPACVARAKQLLRAAGQAPIRLEREIEGFVLNRLQWALLNEAMHLVGEGYCSPDDVDAVLTHGLALRWAHIGPLAVGHLNAQAGLAGYFDVLGEAIARVRASLRTDYAPSPKVIGAVHAAMAKQMPLAELPQRQARRDRNILALRRFLEAR